MLTPQVIRLPQSGEQGNGLAWCDRRAAKNPGFMDRSVPSTSRSRAEVAFAMQAKVSQRGDHVSVRALC